MRIFALLAILFLLPVRILAQEWVATDPRTKGTGNSGVAYVDDHAAAVMNPANLGKDIVLTDLSSIFKLARAELSISVFADIGVEGNTLESLDAIADLFSENNIKSIQDRLNAGTATASDLTTIYKTLENAAELDEDGNGAVVSFGYSGDIRLGNIVVGYRETIFAGVDPVVDLSIGGNAALADGGIAEVLNAIGTTHTPATSAGQSLSSRLQSEAGLTTAQANELAFQAEQSGVDIGNSEVADNIVKVADATNDAAGTIGSGQTFKDNKSGVDIRGLWLREIAVSTGVEVPALIQRLRIGATARILDGTTFTKKVFFVDTEDSSEVFEDSKNSFDENTNSEAGFTLDLGATLPVLGDFLEVALVGRNLIPNSFDFDDQGSFDLRPMARGGVVIRPLSTNLLKVIADIDLTKNEFDGLDGYESRIAGGGVEFSPDLWLLNLALRGGVYTNLLSEDNALLYTFGLSLRFFRFLSLDAALQYSSETVNLESSSNASSDKEVPNRAGGAISLNIFF